MSEQPFSGRATGEREDFEAEEQAEIAWLGELARRVLLTSEWDQVESPRPSDETQAVSL
jgi:hypothetical protein